MAPGDESTAEVVLSEFESNSFGGLLGKGITTVSFFSGDRQAATVLVKDRTRAGCSRQPLEGRESGHSSTRPLTGRGAARADVVAAGMIVPAASRPIYIKFIF